MKVHGEKDEEQAVYSSSLFAGHWGPLWKGKRPPEEAKEPALTPELAIEWARADELRCSFNCAVLDWGIAAELRPTDASIWSNMGRCYRSLAKIEKGQEPNGQLLFPFVATVRLQKAMACFRRALTIDPGDHATWRRLARVYSELGFARLAASTMEKAAQVALSDRIEGARKYRAGCCLQRREEFAHIEEIALVQVAWLIEDKHYCVYIARCVKCGHLYVCAATDFDAEGHHDYWAFFAPVTEDIAERVRKNPNLAPRVISERRHITWDPGNEIYWTDFPDAVCACP